MKVILTEKVPALGNVGEIVNVSAGHGRNYLIPNKLAVLADESNKKELAAQQKRLAKKIEEQKSIAVATKKKIDGLVVELTKKVGGSGKLFGTVTNTEIAKELAAKEIEIERRLITIATPIKGLGTFDLKAKLFEDVVAEFQVKVVMDPEQAKELKEKQAAANKKKKKDKADQILEAKEESDKGEEAETEESTESEIKEFENAEE